MRIGTPVRGALLAGATLAVALAAFSGEPPAAPGAQERRPGTAAAPGRTAAAPEAQPPVAQPPAARLFNLVRTGEMNVIDEVIYALAEHRLAADRVQEAVALLERVASSSPDKEARSVSRYNLGRIFEERLLDAVRARTEYARVCGRWGGTARNRVLAPLRRERKWAEAIEFLRECLAVATDPEDKSDIARSMLATIRESGELSLVESILEPVTKAITYEEAQAAAEARRRKADELRRSQAELSPGGPGRGADEAEIRPQASQRVQGAVKGPFGGRIVPPRPGEPARTQPSERRAKLEAELRELEQAGFEEEAKRVREQLEKGAGGERF